MGQPPVLASWGCGEPRSPHPSCHTPAANGFGGGRHPTHPHLPHTPDPHPIHHTLDTPHSPHPTLTPHTPTPKHHPLYPTPHPHALHTHTSLPHRHLHTSHLSRPTCMHTQHAHFIYLHTPYVYTPTVHVPHSPYTGHSERWAPSLSLGPPIGMVPWSPEWTTWGLPDIRGLGGGGLGDTGTPHPESCALKPVSATLPPGMPWEVGCIPFCRAGREGGWAPAPQGGRGAIKGTLLSLGTPAWPQT